jgi:hypothetical protein
MPKPIFGLRILSLILPLAFGSCHEVNSDSEQEETVFDYSSLVAMRPDSFMRPDLQWISSCRLPSDRYGFHLAFDGFDSTIWSSAPGLNHLEGFEWYFERPVNLGQVHIKTEQTGMFAQPDRVLVFTDRGQFECLPNIDATMPDSITRMKMVFILGANWSRVALPLKNSSFSSVVRVQKGLSMLFDSKPLGIAEIRFKSSTGILAPFVYSDGFVRITEQQKANDRFELNDGRRFSSIKLDTKTPERRLFFQFPDLRPILGFRIRSEFRAAACLQLAWHKPNGSTAFFTINQGDWEQKLSTDTVATKNISFTLRLLEGKEIGISEFDFWDGAKWYRIQEDSLQRKLDLNGWKASIPKDWPLNVAIGFDEGFVKKATGAADWDTERDALMAATTHQTVHVLFRANGLFEMLWKASKDAPNPYVLFSGNWKWTENKLDLKGNVWGQEGVFESQTEYSLIGNRMIPAGKAFPEFEFSY